MKKIYLSFILILLGVTFFATKNTFAYSDEFTLLLETMEVPKTNKSGLPINEEVYNQYKLFVYGSPLDNLAGQRWKNVEDGKWTKYGGAWNGTGTRGEYWILGFNYYDKEVHNHCFPVDIEPPTMPTEWRYAVIPDALESWQENEKYMDDVQREYMLTQKLTRNQVAYDLTVKDIGFDKVRLENYATWRTQGTVYTQRYDKNNKKWAANFMIPPMAGDADLEGYAKFPLGTEYTIKQEENSIEIPITYGSQVLYLTDYAKKEHVKEIKSQLYINGQYVDEIIDNQALEVRTETMFHVDKNDYSQKVIALDVQIKSTLFTTFITDGAMIDVKNYTLYINCENVVEEPPKSVNNNVINEDYIKFPEFPPPRITSAKLKRIVNNNEELLLISSKTENEFICAGQTLAIYVKATGGADKVTIEFDGDTSINTFDKLTRLFEWQEPRDRNQKTLFKTLKEFESMYNGKCIMENLYAKTGVEEFTYKYIIPYETKQTLHSWSTLRKQTDDAFKINESKLFSRISEPYEIVFKVSGPTGKTTYRIKLDVFERWDTLYNRDLSKYIKIRE